MASRKSSPEQRAERRARELELVQESVEQLRSSEGWQRWLQTRSRFRSYSWRNTLLIAGQHPTATRVAGFRAWLGLGYAVQRGEEAIRIWAPCPPSKRAIARWREQGSDPAEEPRMGWRLTAVFAQDQVAPLPPPAEPAPLEPPVAQIDGDSHRHLIAGLDRLAGELGYSVQVAEPGRGDGFCNLKTRVITIAAALSPNAAVAVRIHEIAHALVDVDRRNEDRKLSYAEEELVVESIAYLCSRTVGLETDANSIPYLASWAEQAELDVLKDTVQLIDRLAGRIDKALSDDEDREALTESTDGESTALQAAA